MIYSSNRFNYVKIDNAFLIRGNLSGKFFYTNFRGFSLAGNVKAYVGKEKINLRNLFLDSDRFSLEVWGELGKKEGDLNFTGIVKPIKKPNFLMETIAYRGKAQISLPYVNLAAEIKEPLIRIGEEEIRDVKGDLKGEGKLFSYLFAEANIYDGELRLKAKYRILPENYLTFSYENLKLTEKVFKLKENVRAVFSGEGEILFKERRLNVKGNAESVSIAGNNFDKGSFVFTLLFGQGGKLEAQLSEPGLISLSLNFSKEEVHGVVKVENIELIKEFEGRIKGDITFKRSRKSTEVSFLGNLNKPSYKGFSFPDINFSGFLKKEEVVLSISGKGIRADFSGKLKNLKGNIRLRNFTAAYKESPLSVKEGLINLLLKDGTFKAKGRFKELVLKYGNLKLSTSGGLEASKERVLELKLKGVLSAHYLNKPIDKSLKYAFDVKGNKLEFRGLSKRTKLRLNYSLRDKKGSFGGSYSTEEVSSSFWGRIEGDNFFGEGKLKVKVLEDYVKLRGEFSGGRESVKLSLKPYIYRGKLLSYTFGGLHLVKDKEQLSITFGGLRIAFLGRKILTLSKSEGKGELKNFIFTPIEIDGVVNGRINVKYDGEPYISSKGKVNLTLLSKNMASLIRSEFEGVMDYEFNLRGKNFKLIASMEEIVKVRSAYAYEPFIAAINLEVVPNSLMFSMVNWFKNGYLTAYALTEDYKNFDVVFKFSKAPLKYFTDELKVALDADGEGKVELREFKKVRVLAQTSFEGTVRVLKIPQASSQETKKLPISLEMDLSFKTKTGLTVKVPEGRLFAGLKGRVYGAYPEFSYDIGVHILSGKLSYFGKDFIVKRGDIELHRKEEVEERYINLELNTWVDPYKIFIKVSGDINDPDVYYFSEPPMSKREVLLTLIGGRGNKAILPVATALTEELRGVEEIKGRLERLFDVKIDVGLQTTPTGDLGAVVRLRKRISRLFKMSYQVSSLKDRRASFFEAEVKPPTDPDLGFQFFMYSDDTREYRLKYRREFNF